MFFACFAAVLPAQTCAPIPTSYTLTVLPTLGGRISSAAAINSSGAVTGFAETSALDMYDPFLWTATGGIQDLGTLTGTFGYGTAINDLGTVAGYGEDPANTGYTRPFLWTSSKGLQELNNLSKNFGSFSSIHGIDPKNRLVGNTGQYPSHSPGVAALWSAAKIYNLAAISGDISFTNAYGISDNMLVVGTGSAALPPDYAVAWSLSSGLIQLPGLLGTSFARAFAINKSGTIIAGDDSDGGNFEAVAWILDSGSGQYVLNDLGAGQAFAINDVCQVVGDSGLQKAFIWTPTQGRVDLNTLIPPGSGVVLRYANGINNAGQIVGTTANNRQGYYFGYVLTPVQ
jgi:probable HAF family extracellular repeat protein